MYWPSVFHHRGDGDSCEDHARLPGQVPGEQGRGIRAEGGRVGEGAKGEDLRCKWVLELGWADADCEDAST